MHNFTGRRGNGWTLEPLGAAAVTVAMSAGFHAMKRRCAADRPDLGNGDA